MSDYLDPTSLLSFLAGASLTFAICQYLHEPPELEEPSDPLEKDFLQIIRELRKPFTLAEIVLLRERLGKVPQLKNLAEAKRLKVIRKEGQIEKEKFYAMYYSHFKHYKHRIEAELTANTRKIAFYLKKSAEIEKFALKLT